MKQGWLYSTDVRAVCMFADGSEYTFLLPDFGRRSLSGQVTWNRSSAGRLAVQLAKRAGLGEPVGIRMSLVKGV